MVWANILLPGWGLSGERHRKWFSWCWFWEHKVFVDTELIQMELHAPCAHRAKFRYMRFHGHRFFPRFQARGHQVMVRWAALGCL